jgi:hypothetical protein
MDEEKAAPTQELGFNSAWWMAVSIAVILAAVVGIVTATVGTLLVLLFLGIGVLCAAVAVTGAAHARGYVFQSPMRLSANQRPKTSTADWSYGIALLILTALIFEVGLLVGEIKRVNSTPSAVNTYEIEREKKLRADKQIPDPFSVDDQGILKKSLAVPNYEGPYRFQIIREDDARSREFADSLSAVLKSAKWTETTPVASPAPGYPLPLGITIRCGTVDPASAAGNSLVVSLREVGLTPDHVVDATLRAYDYIIIYVSDHGYLPHE